jgi:ATP-dependent RNA helicase DeaD
MSTFSNLGINKDYIKAIKELGISTPSEIQEKAIPILLGSSTDFIGLAQTGTGKTAAFGLPILHHVNANSDKIQAYHQQES